MAIKILTLDVHTDPPPTVAVACCLLGAQAAVSVVHARLRRPPLPRHHLRLRHLRRRLLRWLTRLLLLLLGWSLAPRPQPRTTTDGGGGRAVAGVVVAPDSPFRRRCAIVCR